MGACLSSWLLLAGLVWGQAAPDPGPRQLPGPLRVDVTFVPVDVFVTDAKGAPVNDLTKEDFVIFEDGVIQDITHFSIQRFGAPREAPTAPVPGITPPQPAPLPVAAPDHRSFLIVLGRGRHSQSFDTMKQLIRFVQDQVSPGDLVAVMAYGRATDLTLNHKEIVALLERFGKENAYIETTLEGWAKGLNFIYGSQEVPPKTRARIDRIFAAPGLASTRASTTGPSELAQHDAKLDRYVLEESEVEKMRTEVAKKRQIGSDRPRDLNARYIGGWEGLKLRHITDLPFDEYLRLRGGTSQDLLNIFSAIEYLRFVEGEKHLVFFTGHGLFLPDLEDDASIASVASDARVRIHTIQTGGMDAAHTEPELTGPTYMPRLATHSSTSFALGSVRKIAALTGGLTSTRSDIGDALRSLGAATRSVYLLGYRPRNTNFDGRFRKINLGVRRKDLNVHARRGYYAHPTIVPYDREKFMIYARTVTAANYREEIDDIRVNAKVDREKPKDGQVDVSVSLIIRPAENLLVAQEGRYTGKLALTCFAVDEDDNLFGDAWNTLEMSLPESMFQKARREGLPANVRLRLPSRADHARLKVIVYDPRTDKLGSTVNPIW